VSVWVAAAIGRRAGPIPIAWAAAGLPFLCWMALKGLAGRSLNRGRYARALRMAKILVWLAPASARHLRRLGAILLYAGRLAEAEKALRKALAQGTRKMEQAVTLEVLGRVLMYEDRYEEATKALEGSARLRPRHGAAYSAMAEVLLWQGTELDKALALTNRALDYEGRRPAASGPSGFAEAWAVHAWALGLLRQDNISQAVQRTLQATDDTQVPQLAGVYWRLGMATAAVGEKKAAARHFATAREIDPQGMYGALAAEALAETKG
jgi:tetratricopeptide (TPR) repeat protein